MRTRTTWWLGTSVLAVGMAYWWWEGRTDLAARQQLAAQAEWRIRADDVTELVWQRGRDRWVCRRVDGEWRLVEPVNARADAGELDRLLTKLERLLPGDLLGGTETDPGQPDPARYGLFPPQDRVEWVQDGRRRVLYIGRRAPLGNRLYVMRSADETIWSVSDDLLGWWPETIDQLRDRMLFTGNPHRIYRVDVRRRDGFLQVQREPDGSWRLVQPLTAAADRRVVREWVDQLFTERITSFVAEGVSDGTVYGLREEDATAITLWIEGQGEGQTIWIGGAVDGAPDTIYARRQSGRSVFAVPAQLRQLARIPTEELRDRRLVPFPIATVREWQLWRNTERIVTLERMNTNDWTVTYPAHWPAEKERVNAILAAWSSARIKRFHDTPYGLGINGAEESPAIDGRTLVLASNNEGNGSVRLRWLAPLDGGERWLLQQGDQELPVEIDGAPIAATVWDPLFYRGRRIFAIDRTHVRQLSWQHGIHEGRAEPDATGRWRLLNGGSPPWPTAIEDVLETLTQLEAAGFVADRIESDNHYGFDEPQALWTIGLKAEAGIARHLIIGAPRSAGGVYARTRGQRAVFWLDATTADVLLPTPESDVTPDPPTRSTEPDRQLINDE